MESLLELLALSDEEEVVEELVVSFLLSLDSDLSELLGVELAEEALEP